MFDWSRRQSRASKEEVERSFEDFYEDVHTEFLKFGEIINFKVCRNGSAHLRGNVYVHYKLLDSALLAYQSIYGRFFAGKQVKCEYVGVTRWKIAICGEYMKTHLSTCSRGITCNFIHCFCNPCEDYEWADWDKAPPNYWVEKMSALFGYTYDSIDEFRTRSPRLLSDKNSQRSTTPDAKRSRGRDRSTRKFLVDTHCSRVSNRLRKEVEVTKDSNTKCSRMCGSEDESSENGGLDVDQVKDRYIYHCGRTRQENKNKHKSCCTNWGRGRDDEEVEEEERLTLNLKYREGTRDGGKGRALDTNSVKRMGRDGDVNNDREGKENGHNCRKKRSRRSDVIRHMAELSNMRLKDDGHQ